LLSIKRITLNLIKDDNWPRFVKTVRLAENATLHHIRVARKRINDKMPTIPTAGGRGYQYYDLEEYIRWLLEKDPPKNPEDPIYMKFGVDGCSLTVGKKTQQEVAAFNLIGKIYKYYTSVFALSGRGKPRGF